MPYPLDRLKDRCIARELEPHLISSSALREVCGKMERRRVMTRFLLPGTAPCGQPQAKAQEVVAATGLMKPAMQPGSQPISCG